MPNKTLPAAAGRTWRARKNVCRDLSLDVRGEVPSFSLFDPATGFADNASCRSSLFHNLKAALWTEHADHFGQRVRCGAVSRNNRHEAVIGQAKTGAGVDDVGIALAADLQPLKQVSGSGQGSSAYQNETG